MPFGKGCEAPCRQKQTFVSCIYCITICQAAQGSPAVDRPVAGELNTGIAGFAFQIPIMPHVANSAGDEPMRQHADSNQASSRRIIKLQLPCKGLLMLATVESASLLGIDAYVVRVETDISSTIPMFAIVGLPNAAVQESRERVRSAISSDCWIVYLVSFKEP